MSKGLRVLLHTLQVLSLLAALLFMFGTFAVAYFDFGGTAYEEAFVGTWAMGFGILSIAFSPALWSLHRGSEAAAPAAVMGGYGRVGEQPPVAVAPPHSGAPAAPGTPVGPAGPGAPGGFEPLSADRGPAPPSSSYGQPSGPNFGAQPSGGTPPTSPPQGESPWGGSR